MQFKFFFSLNFLGYEIFIFSSCNAIFLCSGQCPYLECIYSDRRIPLRLTIFFLYVPPSQRKERKTLHIIRIIK